MSSFTSSILQKVNHLTSSYEFINTHPLNVTKSSKSSLSHLIVYILNPIRFCVAPHPPNHSHLCQLSISELGFFSLTKNSELYNNISLSAIRQTCLLILPSYYTTILKKFYFCHLIFIL